MNERSGSDVVVRRSYIAAVPLLLFLIVGLSIAVLCSYETGWGYYRESHFVSILAGPTGVTELRVHVGWIKGSNTISSRLHAVFPASFAKYAYLREVSEAGQVFGGLVAGVEALSILAALAYGVLWLLAYICPPKRRPEASRHPRARRPDLYPHRLWPVAMAFALVNFGLCIVLYILIAVGTARYTKKNLGAKKVPWPDWAFFTGLAQAALWAALWAFSAAERRREKRLQARSTLPDTQLVPPSTAGTIHKQNP